MLESLQGRHTKCTLRVCVFMKRWFCGVDMSSVSWCVADRLERPRCQLVEAGDRLSSVVGTSARARETRQCHGCQESVRVYAQQNGRWPLVRKTGNWQRFWRLSGNIGDCAKNWKSSGEKILSWKSGQKLFYVSLHICVHTGTLYISTCVSYVVEVVTEACVTFTIFHDSVTVDGTGVMLSPLWSHCELLWSLTLALVLRRDMSAYHLRWTGMLGYFTVSGE